MNQTQKHRGGLSPTKYLTPQELTDVLEYMLQRAETRDSRLAWTDYMICRVLAGSGIRAAELCDLRIEDLPGHHGKDVLYVRDGKGSVSRSVMISKVLGEDIAQYVAVYRAEAKPEHTLFLSIQATPLLYNALWRKMIILGQEMGLATPLRCHKFRHSFAIKLYAQKEDIIFVSTQLGHKDLETTMIYARTDPESGRQQMEGF
jgi:integrase/recombinase XerD